MTAPTREQRVAFERDVSAVELFVTAGMLPMLAAAAGGEATRIPAVLYLRQNVATRAALDGAVRDLRGGAARARQSWEAGRYDEAIRLASVARNGALELFRTVQRAIPEADRLLANAAAKLLASVPDALNFGGGLAIAVLVVGLLAFAGGSRR